MRRITPAAVLSLMAMAAWDVKARADLFTSSNLLDNPSGETGQESPWGLNGIHLTSGPLSLGSSGIDATDGSYWFTTGPTTPSALGNVTAGSGVLDQFVSLGSLAGPAQSVTFRGDFSGLAQAPNGGGTPQYQVQLRLAFFDDQYNLLADDFSPSNGNISPVGSPQVGLSFTASAPAGAAWVTAIASFAEIYQANVPTDTPTFLFGADNFALTATYEASALAAPEPSNLLFGALAALAAIEYASRRRGMMAIA